MNILIWILNIFYIETYYSIDTSKEIIFVYLGHKKM